MVNRAIFATKAGTMAPAADSTNEAGGKSYARSSEESLAQYALTGTIGNTFYATAEEQLVNLLKYAAACDVQFVAKTAVYAREKGLMKDTPVILLASLFARDHKDFFNGVVGKVKRRKIEVYPTRSQVLTWAFRKVVTDTKALRNFAQVIRSGVTGRKSFGSTAKHLMEAFLTETPAEKLFFGSIGTTPTLGQVIDMVRPTPPTPGHNSLYRWLIDDDVALVRRKAQPNKTKKPIATKKGPAPPAFLKSWLDWNADRTLDLPKAPFEMLTEAAGKDTELWRKIAKQATWNQLRQTLATFMRHGIFKNNKALIHFVASKLRDPEQVAKARAFPYGIMRSYQAAVTSDAPKEIQEALLEALDHSLQNIPELPGHTYVFCDTSGSMSASVTGGTVTCREVAALFAAAIMAKCKGNCTIVGFTDRAHTKIVGTGDEKYMKVYEKIRAMPSGNTDCSAPMKELESGTKRGWDEPSTIIYLSDNESWFENYQVVYGGPTGTQASWQAVSKRFPEAKVICIDLAPNIGTQVKDSGKVLNIGGFSNSVFDLVGLFANGELESSRLRNVIDGVLLQ